MPAAALALMFGAPASAYDLTYLQSLLAGAPEGGWVKANLTPYSSAWATQAQGGLPPGTYSNPGLIVLAWSSIAWDSNRGQLMLWGGGHANYMGNEMYLWEGTTGNWTRGSLPSRLQSGVPGQFLVVDSAAPQSAHTYDNNLYLPVIDRFVTFGGAVFNTGGGFQTRDAQGNVVPAGPWFWDPAKADANRVGGTTGSGYLAGTQGNQMWSDRNPLTSGTRGGGPIEGTTAYRLEGGRDVVYTTRDANASGFPSLYRYEPGDPNTGALDRWDRVGLGSQAASYQSAAAIDSINNLYVRTAFAPSNLQRGLGVWDLDTTNPTSPAGDRFVRLEFADGSPFNTTVSDGLSFDEASGYFLMWDGNAGGTVYYTKPEFLANGALDPVWTVTRVNSATAAQPTGNFNTAGGPIGILGKWQYIDELGAFIALDNFNSTTGDAPVWLYKPVAVVPEVETGLMMLAGLLTVTWISRRRRVAN